MTNNTSELIKNQIDNPTNITEKDLWDLPDVSLLKGGTQPPPELPIKLFGDKWGDWILKSAKTKNSPPDFIATSLLGGIASLIGNSRRAVVWKGWNEPTILWFAIVGLPSSGKSPATDTVIEPIRNKEKELGKNYESEFAKYLQDKDIAEAHYKRWQDKVKKAIGDGITPPAKPKEAEEPPYPPRPRLIIYDTTIEKLADLLQYVPKGLLLYRDELSSLLKNFERRGGSDREFYLEAYGGRSYTVDRVKHLHPIFVNSLSISILGGMQPDKMMSCLHNGDDDGLGARFLYCWAEGVEFERPTAFPDNELINSAIEKLSSLKMQFDEEKNPISKMLYFTERAKQAITEWKKEQPEKEKKATGLLVSHIGKLGGMAVRLSTVFAYLEWVESNQLYEPEKIEERHIVKAIALIEDYFLPMAIRCFGNVSLTESQRDSITIAKWIVSNKPKIINASDFRRMQGSPLRETKRIEDAFKELEELNWIRFVGGRDGENGGRQRKDYDINPRLWEVLENE